jgi:integrase
MSYEIDETKYLTPLEVERLHKRLEFARTLMERLIIEVALATGARASEVLALTRASMNHEARTLFIVGLKDSKNRSIPLRDKLWGELTEYARQLEGEKLFDISIRQFQRIWARYMPVKKKLHSLRHTFAIELYKKHRDLRLVQIALGHKSIANTMVYAACAYETEELRRLIC